MILNEYQDIKYDIAETAEYHPWVFYRGWLLAPTSVVPVLPGVWHEQRVGQCQLYLHPATVLTRAGNLYVLGHIFDVRAPLQTNAQVVEALWESWQISEQYFREQLSYCNGCFTLLFGEDGRVVVYTDATSIAPVFYNAKSSVIASHSLLLAMCEVGGTKVQRYNIYAKFGYPGRLTPYRGVYSLNPGCYLVLGGGPVRYKHLVSPFFDMKYSEVLDEFSDLLCASMEAFSSRKNLVMSLTAGFDSRAALAASKDIENIEFFTYYRDDAIDTDKIDRVISGKIAEDNSLNHSLILVRNNPCPASYRRLCDFNSHYPHVRDVSYNYFLRWGQSDVFHVRSNLSEIGRAFYSYRLPGDVPRPANLETALKCYVSGNMKNSRYYNSYTQDLYQDIYTDYMESSQAKLIDAKCDYRDVFYWEHRMGAWHSQVAAESSAAFETLSVYNCDHILRLMLQPKFKDRRDKKLMLGSIEKNWPALLLYAINPPSL